MNRILITGFDAFGNLDVNPSAQLVEHLRESVDGIAIAPTSYLRAHTIIREEAESLQPQIILMFGYAASASGLRLERQATNRTTSLRPDNEGESMQGPIDQGAPATLQTQVDVDAISESLAARGHEVSVSDRAGGYVCNYSYYKLLRDPPGRALVLFAHLSRDTVAEIQTARQLILELRGLETN